MRRLVCPNCKASIVYFSIMNLRSARVCVFQSPYLQDCVSGFLSSLQGPDL